MPLAQKPFTAPHTALAVTPSWAANDQALRLHALHRAMFSHAGSAHVASVATDAQGLIQIFSAGAEHLLGYTSAEVVNTLPVTQLFMPQALVQRAALLGLTTLSSPAAADLFDALVRKARTDSFEICELLQRHRSGASVPTQITITPLLAEWGNPQNGAPVDTADRPHDHTNDQTAQHSPAVIGYLLVSTDLSDHQRAQQALRDTEAFKRSILNSLSAEIAVIDQDGVIREVNQPWQRFAIDNGFEPGAPAPFTGLGTNYLAVCAAAAEAPGVMPPAYVGIQAVLNGELPSFSLEYPCDSPTEARWFSMSVLPLGQHARAGAVIAHTDISEYKRLENALKLKNTELERARKIADKANRAKSQFLSNMSHELRTPLGTILGFAQLIESGLPEPTASQKRSVDQILHAGWYQLELINDILDLARVESGQLLLAPEAVQLKSALQQSQGLVEDLARQRGIAVTVALPQPIVFIHADPTRFKQVMVNLLTNAIKYNKVGGTVTVDCVSVEPGSIRIRVRDTGLGLSRQQLSQLFQPFNRLGQESSREEGTGIGLVMTKRLLGLMEGSVGVESRPGEGSVFWAELLLMAEPQADNLLLETSGPLAATAPQRMHTLLYVEDNPSNLLLLQDLLSRRPDLRLLTASTGEAGVALARSALPDVILMDIYLPGMSGLQALTVLKNDATTAHIPVLALSANAMPHDVSHGLNAGFFSYVTKPIRITEFMLTLGAALALAQLHTPPSQAKHDITPAANPQRALKEDSP